MGPSSSGLGHHPFKVETGVRVSVALPKDIYIVICTFIDPDFLSDAISKPF